MKKLNIIFLFLFSLIMVSCQDELTELGPILDKSSIKFSVTQPKDIDAGGNTVILKNNTSGVIAVWDYGTGKSLRDADTIHFAFKGTYTVKLSVMTANGIVTCDPVNIEVTQDNLMYVNDPLWIALSGGPGNSKTWILDNGKYGLGTGPMAYADPKVTQEFDNYTINWEPEDIGQKEADMATSMTFDLKGGPHLTTIKPNEPGAEVNGNYMLNTNSHTLTTFGTTIIRTANMIGNASNWTTDLKILVLNEKQLRIAVMRTNSEGPWLYVYNYVSKKYADNYVPTGGSATDPGYNPSFAPGELLKMLTGGKGSGQAWKMDATGNPVDWIKKGKGWTSKPADSQDWGWNASWETAVKDAWISFDQIDGFHFTRYQNGKTTKGTFSINEETNEITLVDNTLLTNTGSWMSPDNATKIKVVKAFNSDYSTKGIWFGTSYDAGKDEWLAFHYVLASHSTSDAGYNPSFAPGELIKMLTSGTGNGRAWTIDASGNPVDWIAKGKGWTVNASSSSTWGWNTTWETAIKDAWISFDQIDGLHFTRFQNGVTTKGTFTVDESTNEITLVNNTLLTNPDSWMSPNNVTKLKVVKAFNADYSTKGIWFGTSYDAGKDEWLAFHYVITAKK